MHVDPMKSLIVEHLAGSHAYGTNIATSDVDKRGIFCAGAINIRTPFFPIREVTMQDEEDGKLYELTQFMNLYVGMNPNIVETLWVDPMHIITKHEAYDYLRANAAQQLLNKKAAFTFSGYAVAQLKRIKGHNKWINNPQEVDAPRQTRFVSLLHNFSNQKMFSVNIEDFRDGYRLIHYGGDIYGVYEAPGYQTFDDIYTLNTNSDDLTDFYTKEPTPAEQYAGTILRIPDFGTRRLPLFMVKFHRENYRQAKEVWQNYWNWKKNRNVVRSEMEQKFGYDCYSADTEFLTESGWKLFDDVTMDNKLATFDDNANVQYYPYSERFDSKYTGNLYHYTGEHYDCMVTANHQMVYRPYERNNKKPTHDNFIKAPAAELPACFQVRATINPRIKVYEKCQELQSTGRYTDTQFLSLMGWYLSDGTSYTNKKTNKCRVRISQSKNSQLMQNAKKMANKGLLRRYETKTTIGGLIENIFVVDIDVSTKLVEECGHGSHNKRIPRYMFSQSKRLMKHLLMNMIYGDGTCRDLKESDDTYVYYTCNSKLADDVQELAMLCGFVTAKWGPYTNTTPYGVSTMYQVHININPSPYKTMYDQSKQSNIARIPVTDYRTVCFTVPNHTLITRRNGKIALQGNCKHAMHLVRLLRMGEEILTDGVVNVARPDAEELLTIRGGAWTYEEIVQYAEHTDHNIREVLYKTSPLPKAPDLQLAGKVLMECQDIFWETKKDE